MMTGRMTDDGRTGWMDGWMDDDDGMMMTDDDGWMDGWMMTDG